MSSPSFLRTSTPNSKWHKFSKNQNITVPCPVSIVSDNPRIFTMGSCLAMRLKERLANTCTTLPSFRDLSDIDYQQTLLDTINNPNFVSSGYHNDHLNHYTPASIYQEILRSTLSDISDIEDYIVPVNVLFNYRNGVSSSYSFQDVGRRDFFSNLPSELKSVSLNLASLLRKQIQSADLFLFTLGHIEQFYLMRNDRYIFYNQHPFYSSARPISNQKVSFSRLEFSEIVGFLQGIIKLIRSLNTKSPIVFTVSPIPLDRTFSGDDIVSANTYSKSLLRVAVNEVLSLESSVLYFPSYEFAMQYGQKFFETRDFRHPRAELTNVIVDQFLETFLKS